MQVSLFSLLFFVWATKATPSFFSEEPYVSKLPFAMERITEAPRRTSKENQAKSEEQKSASTSASTLVLSPEDIQFLKDILSNKSAICPDVYKSSVSPFPKIQTTDSKPSSTETDQTTVETSATTSQPSVINKTTASKTTDVLYSKPVAHNSSPENTEPDLPDKTTEPNIVPTEPSEPTTTVSPPSESTKSPDSFSDYTETSASTTQVSTETNLPNKFSNLYSQKTEPTTPSTEPSTTATTIPNLPVSEETSDSTNSETNTDQVNTSETPVSTTILTYSKTTTKTDDFQSTTSLPTTGNTFVNVYTYNTTTTAHLFENGDKIFFNERLLKTRGVVIWETFFGKAKEEGVTIVVSAIQKRTNKRKTLIVAKYDDRTEAKSYDDSTIVPCVCRNRPHESMKNES